MLTELTDAHEQARTNAILSARRVLARQPIYLDTETTGLSFDDEIVDVAIINSGGEAMLDTLVKPGNPIPASATRIHSITNDDVAAAPRFDVVWRAQLGEILTGSHLRYDQAIVIYNAVYDVRMIKQSLKQYGVAPRGIKQPFCAMHLYAEFYGEWDNSRNSYRWHKLGVAAAQCGIAWPDDLHRALADAQLTRAIVEHIASQIIWRRDERTDC